MDRKAWISISLCIIGLFVWQWWYQKQYGSREVVRQPAADGPAPAMTAEAAPAQPAAAPVAQPAAPMESPAPPATAPVVEEQLARIESKEAVFHFSNVGGGVSTIELLEHAAESGSRVTLNLHQRSIPIGAIGPDPPGMGRDGFEMRVAGDKQSVVFRRTTPEGVEITKKFSLPDRAATGAQAHVVKFEITFRNTGAASYSSPEYYINVGSIAPIHPHDLSLYTGYDFFSQGKNRFIDVNWFLPGKVPLIGIQTRGARPVFSEEAPGLTWAGVKNQYFTSLITVKGEAASAAWARRFEVPAEDDGTPRAGIAGAIGLPAFTLAPGQELTREMSLYAGPKKYDWLSSLGGGQEEVLRYGMFKPVSLVLLKAMNFLKGVFGNYAIAILVLTLIIKSALWPLQNKATNSMRKMSALAPKMKEMQEKLKDDPTRMNQEMMKLYKEYGVNPFGGCLPMLVQIPIFFGFYSMLGSAVELRNSRFLWVHDLSQPDTVFRLFDTIPVNILPLVMAATMLWQMHITPKTGDKVQQRIFMFMPLIFVVFCYNYAAALALYWTTQNLFSIVQLYLTRDRPIPALVKVSQPDARGDGKKRKKKRLNP